MTKKHKFAIVLSAFVACGYCASAALTLNWSYNGTLSTPVPSVQSGWIVQMYQDVSANTVLSSITAFSASDLPQGGNSSDDQLLGSFKTTVGLAKGQYSFLANGLSADTIAGASVYTVLFNSSILASASQAWIIDSATKVLPVSGITTYTPNSVASTVGFGPLTVTPVPEPSSVALIGVGLLAIAVRRRFAK